METLDTLITYACDLTLGGGAFYLGASLTVYLVDRWNKLEVKSKTAVPQTVNLPLTLKSREAEAIPLETNLQEVRTLEAVPVAEPREVEAEFSRQDRQEIQIPEPNLETAETKD